MPQRIEHLTPAQKARMAEWADRWIEIGLRTAPADRETFERGVRQWYRYAGLAEPRVIVWCPSPLVAVMAGPIAARLLHADGLADGVADGGAVSVAVREAVSGAVSEAVGGAVREAVGDAVDGAVGHAVSEAVDEAVSGAVREAVGDAVDGAVGHAVSEAVDEAVSGAVSGAVGGDWVRYIGGQFWVGGWYWGPAYQTFFRDVCGLQLPSDLSARLDAHIEIVSSACWWWPGSDFVMVSERPSIICREQVAPRGWDSHRLHCEDGPAIAWDGWSIYAVHGVRVPEQVVMAPQTLTAAQIAAEPNVEVRRVMIERLGTERYVILSGAKVVARDDWGTLYRAERPDDSPLMAVAVVNSTPEPDGSRKDYWLRVPGVAKASQPPRVCLVCDRDIRDIPTTARQAVAWLGRLCAEHYAPTVET